MLASSYSAFNAGALPFAVLGLGLGWVYLELGAAVVPLLVVPILIARRTFASYLASRAAQEQTIETLILALEAKDRYTAGHAQRVAMFCEYVGAELRFGPGGWNGSATRALMHDIGKLIVPNQLLNKPGRLTESEFERVRRHEAVSVELLRRIDFLAPVAGDTTTEAATAAVEGKGLIEPAIIHVADAFDAMTSTRSYRKALSQETAFDELRDRPGTQFNDGVRRGPHLRDRVAGRALRRRSRGRRARVGDVPRPKRAPDRPGSATCCRIERPNGSDQPGRLREQAAKP